MFKEILLAGVGGFAGSASRYAISLLLFSTTLRTGFPVGTMVVNALGSLLIGVFLTLVPQGGWQTLAIAGFCGGFTTFSAFSLEVVKMMRSGYIPLALIYIVASVTVCVLCTWAGIVLTGKVTGTATM